MNLLLAALRSAHAALDEATVRDERGRVTGWASAGELDSGDLAEAARLQAALEARMAGLRLHVVAAAEACDAKAVTGATDTETWASRAAGRNRPRTWGSLGVAQRLESTYGHVRAALTAGQITEDHARIIVRACEKVTDTLDRLRMDARARGLSPEQVAAVVPTVTAAELAACEELLVAKALMLPPDRLAAAARRVLKPLRRRVEVRLPDVDPDTGELNEVDLAVVVADDQLRDRESTALTVTAMTLGDNGDGTWSGKFTIPELHGQILRNVLEHLTAPRRAHLPGRGVRVEPQPDGPSSHVERLGRAFCEVLEHLPTDGFGRSGANDTTLVVHIDHHDLAAGLGSAVLDTGAEITASEARRLACNAGIVPLVLSGESVPLDLGREKRLFTRHQALALSARHDSCAAQGCERPFAWCELHHLIPWSHGGPTDLANAVPLCGHHHRRIHDPLYHHHLQPDRTITFEHRWPSRHSPIAQRRALHQRERAA